MIETSRYPYSVACHSPHSMNPTKVSLQVQSVGAGCTTVLLYAVRLILIAAQVAG